MRENPFSFRFDFSTAIDLLSELENCAGGGGGGGGGGGENEGDGVRRRQTAQKKEEEEEGGGGERSNYTAEQKEAVERWMTFNLSL